MAVYLIAVDSLNDIGQYLIYFNDNECNFRFGADLIKSFGGYVIMLYYINYSYVYFELIH